MKIDYLFGPADMLDLSVRDAASGGERHAHADPRSTTRRGTHLAREGHSARALLESRHSQGRSGAAGGLTAGLDFPSSTASARHASWMRWRPATPASAVAASYRYEQLALERQRRIWTMTVEMRTPRYTTQVRELPVAQTWRAASAQGNRPTANAALARRIESPHSQLSSTPIGRMPEHSLIGLQDLGSPKV